MLRAAFCVASSVRRAGKGVLSLVFLAVCMVSEEVCLQCSYSLRVLASVSEGWHPVRANMPCRGMQTPNPPCCLCIV